MCKPIIRTDRWKLSSSAQQQVDIKRTIELYRAFVRALIGVVFTHWPEIARAKSRCAQVERFIHHTRKNPKPKYPYFEKHFYKFPSYLRRAAIEAAMGQVSSFVTRYSQWQSGIRNRRDARPPVLNAQVNVYPVLYLGQCLKFHDDFHTAEIKVYSQGDWVWSRVPIVGKRKRHAIAGNKQLSPHPGLTAWQGSSLCSL